MAGNGTYLLSIDNVHDDAAFQHLGQSSLHVEVCRLGFHGGG